MIGKSAGNDILNSSPFGVIADAVSGVFDVLKTVAEIRMRKISEQMEKAALEREMRRRERTEEARRRREERERLIAERREMIREARRQRIEELARKREYVYELRRERAERARALLMERASRRRYR